MDKVVVITGASGGLGKAIADLYRAGGDRVCGLSRSACDEEKDEYRCDVTDEAQVNAAVEKIAAKYGRIDVVINNAGVGVLGATELIPTESIRKAFDVSYYGSLHVSRACLKHMARGGRIIFISSIAGLIPVPFRSVYSSAKAAQLALAEAMRMELKPAGITVVAVCPGEIRTNFSANRIADRATNERYGDRVAASLDRIAAKTEKRMPADVAAKKIFAICEHGRKAVYVVGGKYKFFRFAQKLLPDTFFIETAGRFS